MTADSTRGELEQQVVERAARDSQFRKDFMTNPRETAEREFGVAIPEGIDITVLEETPSSVYVVLPPAQAQAGREVSDADLEAVAGGWGGLSGQACSEAPCGASYADDPCG